MHLSRHLWIHENIAQNNPAKITTGEEQLKHTCDHKYIMVQQHR